MVFLVCVFFAALQMEYERAFRISLERTAPQKYFPGARRFLLEPENCCSPGTLCSESDLLPRIPEFPCAQVPAFLNFVRVIVVLVDIVVVVTGHQ